MIYAIVCRLTTVLHTYCKSYLVIQGNLLSKPWKNALIIEYFFER